MSELTSLIWETFSMPQKGLQFLLMIPTTFPVGFRAASAADIRNYSHTEEMFYFMFFFFVFKADFKQNLQSYCVNTPSLQRLLHTYKVEISLDHSTLYPHQ